MFLRKLCFSLPLLLVAAFAQGATYYLSPSGSDTASGTSAAPWKTFSKAWGVLQAGDTLLLTNGTYNQDASPPAGKVGSSGSLITVQAQNDGGAIIGQEVFFKGNSYIAFIGMKILDPYTAVQVGSNGTGKVSHDLIFQRIGFGCTGPSTSINDGACFGIGDGTNHILIEDSWGWGSARYTVLCYGGPGGNPANTTCDSNTFRRLVIRMGPALSSGGNPQAALSLYYASNNLVENVLVLDSLPKSDSSNAAFYITAHDPPPNVSANKFYGVVALNNLGYGWIVDVDGGGNAQGNELHNSVMWGSARSGVGFADNVSANCANGLLDHSTIGISAEDGVVSGCDTLTIKSNIFRSNGMYGADMWGGSTAAADYNDYSLNTSGARNVVPAGAHDLTSDPGLKYILRTETGTACKGKGEGGTDCGADVEKRYQNGALTATDLWPWPNEARVKADMCTGSDATRGFCAKPSITDYVWNYLGNGNPYSGGTPPPSGSACDLNGDSATNVSDVQLSVNQALGVAACASGDLNKDGLCNVVDVQRVVNAALGGQCVTQ